MPLLPGPGLSVSETDKDREINDLKRKIQVMVDTACCAIEKAHDKGVVLQPGWLDRLGFLGPYPMRGDGDMMSLASHRSNLSTTEWPHDVYTDITVIGTKMRWPRKYRFGGTRYGTPCPEAELLDVLAEGEKIDIIEHDP
jgi:hypothetical protein